MAHREDIPGWMTKCELTVLEALASCIPSEGILVEVGSYLGRSAWTFAQSVHPSVKVYCIDPWPDNLFPKFKENVKTCPNIITIQDLSPRMAWDKNVRPDLVFIDGNHSYPHVDEDIKFWSQQLKKNGILCGHDFHYTWPDVCRAVIKHGALLKRSFRVFGGTTIWF